MKEWSVKKRKYSSPYHYLGEEPLSVLPGIEAPPLDKMFRDHVYQKVEYLILEALYRFPYLNRINIERYLDSKLGVRKWVSYAHPISRLAKDGTICQLRYGDICFYFLPESAREYMTSKGIFLQQPTVYCPPLCGSEVLESASLAQWHLSLMQREGIRNASFQQVRKFKEKIYIPSYAEYLSGNFVYHIFCYALPKNETYKADFLTNIERNYTVMKKAFYKPNHILLTIFLASSLADMEGAEAFFRRWDKFEDRSAYYALESNTLDICGLDCLYYYESTATKENLKVVGIL